MKRGLLLLLLVVAFQIGHAQLFKEWFKQKKTQIEYLVKQIAALQVYIGYVQKGYEIADKGLTTIGNIKNGDFNLHRDFFSALKNVNPKIRNSAQVADIIALQIRIIQVQKRNLHRAKQSDGLTVKEVNYIAGVFSCLLEQTADNVEELTMLITAGNYDLSDDERIRRIDGLHRDMLDKYSFVQWFSDQTEILVTNRKKEQTDADISKSLLLDKK